MFSAYLFYINPFRPKRWKVCHKRGYSSKCFAMNDSSTFFASDFWDKKKIWISSILFEPPQLSGNQNCILLFHVVLLYRWFECFSATEKNFILLSLKRRKLENKVFRFTNGIRPFLLIPSVQCPSTLYRCLMYYYFFFCFCDCLYIV